MEEERLISKFNESVLAIQRLNNDLVEAKYHRKKGHLKQTSCLMITKNYTKISA